MTLNSSGPISIGGTYSVYYTYTGSYVTTSAGFTDIRSLVTNSSSSLPEAAATTQNGSLSNATSSFVKISS